MAGIDLDIVWHPLPIILAGMFDNFGADVRSLRVPLKAAVQEVVAPAIDRNFEAGGYPTTWVALHERTILQKAAMGAPDPEAPLKRSGDLQTVATQLNVWTIDGQEGSAFMQLPEAVEYGYFHEFGTWSHVARPWASMTEEDIDDVVKVFDEWLGDLIGVWI